MAGRLSTTYRSARLTFLRDRIEPLDLDDRFRVETPHGTFEMSKRDFRQVFSNVAQSTSYVEAGSYNYSRVPSKAEAFIVGGRSRISGSIRRSSGPQLSSDGLPTENDVVVATGGFLHRVGWEVLQTLDTQQAGVDVVAVHAASNRRLHVEAKGATSSKPGTSRYGKPFDSSQVRDHVANALYAAARVHEDCSSAIAVPLSDLHIKYMRPIRRSLTTLNIAVFWVEGNDVVDTWNWKPGA